MIESEELFNSLAGVIRLMGYSPDISSCPIRIRFTNGVECNEDLFLIGTYDGAIATKHQYENCQCSFAHLQGDRVMRHGEQIATRSDLLIWNSLQLHE